MKKIEMLREVLEDYRKTPVRIILEWGDGGKAGIANKDAINAAMTALRNELQNQIDKIEKENGTQS